MALPSRITATWPRPTVVRVPVFGDCVSGSLKHQLRPTTEFGLFHGPIV